MVTVSWKFCTTDYSIASLVSRSSSQWRCGGRRRSSRWRITNCPKVLSLYCSIFRCWQVSAEATPQKYGHIVLHRIANLMRSFWLTLWVVKASWVKRAALLRPQPIDIFESLWASSLPSSYLIKWRRNGVFLWCFSSVQELNHGWIAVLTGTLLTET